jgi:hypothetical protein
MRTVRKDAKELPKTPSLCRVYYSFVLELLSGSYRTSIVEHDGRPRKLW